MANDDKSQQKHKAAMEKQKEKVDANIERASKESSVVVLVTGDGKGKSSSGFGMVIRSLGYGHKVGIVQFIKGAQLSGEEMYITKQHPEVDFYQMGTGFTWNTQDRTSDIEAAERTWKEAARMLSDDSFDMVLLDELTYMLGYKYLDEDMVLDAIRNRPVEQSVVVTGRGGGTAIRELADTVSEIKDVKHAFRAGIKARPGVDL